MAGLFDRIVYRLFHWHYNRMSRGTPGFAWILKFTAEEFIERHDPEHKAESAARWFYEAMRDAKARKDS